MSTSKDQPKRRPHLFSEGLGFFSTNKYLCCDLLERRDSWILKPSSRYVFVDGIVWLCAEGKINVRHEAIESFKGYFDLLYKELPTTFSVGRLWRVYGCAILLFSEWKSSKQGLGHESTNENDAGANASGDSSSRSVEKPSSIKENCPPIEAKKGESIPHLVKRFYENAPEDFTPEEAARMILELDSAYQNRPPFTREERETFFKDFMSTAEARGRSPAPSNGGAKRKRVRIKEEPGLPKGTRRCTRQNGEPATIDLT